MIWSLMVECTVATEISESLKESLICLIRSSLVETKALGPVAESYNHYDGITGRPLI